MQKILNRRRLPILLLGALLLGMFIGPACSADQPRATPLDQTVVELSREYRTQLELAPADRVLGLALASAARTWLAVAQSLGAQVEASHVAEYLQQIEKDYQKQTAEAGHVQSVQSAGMNLLYQSLNTTAYLLAKARRDDAALSEIKLTEQRIMEISGQPGQEGPSLAAWSGGALAVLAVTARLLDDTGRFNETLSGELQRRREVDANISELRDVGAGRRIMLLTNNHLFGAFSMTQVIGMLRNAELLDGLRGIEAELMKIHDKALDEQLVAAVKALTEAGFLVAPTFRNLSLADLIPTPQN